MARALVCGAGTFLGAHLAARLVADGHAVTALERGPRSRARRLRALQQVEYWQADPRQTLDHNSDEPWDFIFHVAAPAGPMDLLRDPDGGLYVASDVTRQLGVLASKCGATLVLVSAAALMPSKAPPEDGLFGPAPITRYAERVAKAFETYGDARVRIARVGGIYGPGMPVRGNVLGTLLEQVVLGKTLSVTSPGPLDLCYVGDVADGLIRFALSDVDVPVSFGDEQLVSLDAVINVLDDVRGKSLPRGELVMGDSSFALDLQAARRVLGWRPAIALVTGLRHTLDWFKDRQVAPVSRMTVEAERAGQPVDSPDVRGSLPRDPTEAVRNNANKDVPATIPTASGVSLEEMLGLFDGLEES